MQRLDVRSGAIALIETIEGKFYGINMYNKLLISRCSKCYGVLVFMAFSKAINKYNI